MVGNLGWGVYEFMSYVSCSAHVVWRVTVKSSYVLDLLRTVPVVNVMEVPNTVPGGSPVLGDYTTIMAREYNLASWLSHWSWE